ncbi:3-deoxy-D-manno-octulosonic acid transferase [Candidatus Trichorickettsia mobilis]|uniref:3-deoxy-D-manno-octulosonic acid transferase n=1 Tax=Candidatus Trichorickettsia mobilis TaxID=1346319 RepID=A0ABZ0USY5_9RICK|nr:lipid IV(A) 3-deoxy-D-manno-octulosonic acid transferase [Candidatus Trichorickettsia mobilis]WPY00891.1 3-deoxy-D-manno-octulosonic acid transferase [Candidatus Trichorickettsia mobilis]
MLHVYNMLTILLMPVYIVVLIIRIFRQKEIISRIFERFAFSDRQRPAGALIWVHAASVGESIAAMTIINAINKISLHNFLVTSGTVSSAQILASKLPANAIHQFLPFDNVLVIKKFFKHWQPDLGIIVESELWPCLINEGSKNCKLLWVNARISDYSFQKWQKFSGFFQFIIAKFSDIIVQSSIDFKKLQTLGAKNIINLGNIKFANEKPAVDQQQYAKITEHLQGKKIIVAGSTHFEDEQVILPVVHQLKTQFPNCYLIIVLRHPERKNEVVKFCQNLNLTVSVRSETSLPSLTSDLYIVDSFGELGLFYSIADIVFVGGSFKQGGHNPIEPAHFGKIIIFGPDMSNCQIIANEMIDSDAAVQISDQKELLDKLQHYLQCNDTTEVQVYKNNAAVFIQKHQQILASYLEIISKYINK